jgi:hypothetical protein
MLLNLFYGLSTMAICLLLQSILVVYALRYYASRESLVNLQSSRTTLLVINSVMLTLIIGNIAQVMIWALLFMLLGEFSDFDSAVYHSAVNFATLGYGDIVMSDEYRLLGPLQAINGVLMIGVSTAALMGVMKDAFKKRSQTRRGGT